MEYFKNILSMIEGIFSNGYRWHGGIDAWMGGPIWVSRQPIMLYGCHCNAHVTL